MKSGSIISNKIQKTQGLESLLKKRVGTVTNEHKEEQNEDEDMVLVG